MAAAQVEHGFISAKMEAIQKQIARAKFSVVTAAHQEQRFEKEDDAGVEHRVADPDRRSEASGSAPDAQEISGGDESGTAEEESADKARRVEAVIGFLVRHWLRPRLKP